VSEHILLIRLRSIGDILFTRPAVHAVRDAFPGARISFLTYAHNAPLLEGFRDVDEVIALDQGCFRRLNPAAIARETFTLLRRLRGGRFSLVVDFQGYGETAWLARWSSAAQRWGNLDHATRRWVYTGGTRRNLRIHPAEWNLSLLRECGLSSGTIRNEFALPDSSLAEARRQFEGLGLDPGRRSLFVQPFTSSPQKNWPLDRYLEVARHWHLRGVQILFGGGPADQPALQAARDAGFRVAAGNPLLVTAGLMKLSTLVLGGDTGLLHMAVAMNQRVLMVMRTNVPGSSHPFQHPDWAVTPPPRQPVHSLGTKPVLEASAAILGELKGEAATSGDAA
jgi:ADP-heptose:LPS heptosyltransferase